MSSRGSVKRKVTEEDSEELTTAKMSKSDDVVITSSRSGRTRKKTAKLLEMEAFEVEVAGTTKAGKAAKRKTSHDAGELSDNTDTLMKKSPTKSPLITKIKFENISASATSSDIHISEVRTVKNEEQLSPAQANLPPAPPPPLKIMLSIPQGAVQPTSVLPTDVMSSQSESESEHKLQEEVKSKSKPKRKALKKTPPADVEVSPQEETEDSSPPSKSKKRSKKADILTSTEVKVEPLEIKVESSGSLSLDIENEDVKPDLSIKDENPLVMDEESTATTSPAKKKKKSQKKKKVRQDPSLSQPALLHFEPSVDSSKMEMLDYADFVDNMEITIKQDNVDGGGAIETGQVVKKKSKVKKLSRKSLGEASKKKLGATGFFAKEGKGKGRKRPGKVSKKRTTAYTLWCNNMRRELMIQYPSLDFSMISKKLAELWQTVSVQEKNMLKRNAKRIQKRQNQGKEVALNMGSASKHMRSGQQIQQTIDRNMKLLAPTPTPPPQPTGNYHYKVVGNAPLDVAAHLKLLGESLGTIGARLQEHRGQIAVQGSLSVLLDSMLCALGPLMCLTNQVPELNSVPPHVHKVTLDNVAYIMPGIG